nr:hypothetical protein CFP56_32330 [Quercus suber]
MHSLGPSTSRDPFSGLRHVDARSEKSPRIRDVANLVWRTVQSLCKGLEKPVLALSMEVGFVISSDVVLGPDSIIMCIFRSLTYRRPNSCSVSNAVSAITLEIWSAI